MVSHDDVCDSCGAVGRTCQMRWPDGETREMCGPCERQWQLIWRHFCEFQPRQANRVRAQANRANRARPDGGEPMTDGGRPATFTCDDCGDETPTDKRSRYLRPNQPADEGEPVTGELCPRCTTGKASSRLFRADEDIAGGDGGA